MCVVQYGSDMVQLGVAVLLLGSALVQIVMVWLYMVKFRLWCGSDVCGLVLNGSALVQLWFSCEWHWCHLSSTAVVKCSWCLMCVVSNGSDVV